MRHYIQHWNQPAEEVENSKNYACYWNPHTGNVRVGNQEVKWYNMFK